MLAGRIEVREDGNWDDFDGRVAPKSRAGIRSVPIAASLRAHLDAHLKWTKRKGGDLIGKVVPMPTGALPHS